VVVSVRRRAAALLLALVLCGPQLAARQSIFYVATTGNDSNNGSLGSPWLTIAKALATLTAGQTALCRAGTYSEHDLSPTNDGTSGSPITLGQYPGETCIIDGGYTTSSGWHPIFYLDADNYWTFDGITVTRGSNANFRIGENTTTTGFTFQNGVCTYPVTGDNAACVYLDINTVTPTITNNVIHDRTQDSDPGVSNGIVLFRASGATITNNTIYNYANGIYFKHNDAANAAALVSKNVIHDVRKGIQWTMHDSTISYNLVYSASDYAINVYVEAGTCASIDSRNNTFNHNTLVGSGASGVAFISIAPAGGCTNLVQGNVVTNSVVSGYGSDQRGYSVDRFGSATSDFTGLQVTYSLGYDATSANAVNVISTNYYAMTACPASITCSNNVQAVPTYTNAGTRDYRLASGNGKNAASDGTDMGAYTDAVTCIGATADPYPVGCTGGGVTTGPIRLRTRPGLLE
jgi:parallel beta-helix repeat protein